MAMWSKEGAETKMVALCFFPIRTGARARCRSTQIALQHTLAIILTPFCPPLIHLQARALLFNSMGRVHPGPSLYLGTTRGVSNDLGPMLSFFFSFWFLKRTFQSQSTFCCFDHVLTLLSLENDLAISS